MPDLARVRSLFSRRTLRADLIAGVVLGVESVPDGLAAGLLAGVNPLAGLYSYLYGMVGAAFFTSSTFLAVQSTGSMALVVSDAQLASSPDPQRALVTLTLLTGALLVIAGLAGVGKLVRFAPTAVMTGFLMAVGVNIVLGQLAAATGYSGRGPNRVVRTVDTLLHLGQWNLATTVTSAITILSIVVLVRTRLGALGMVVAVVVGSLTAAMLNLWIPRPVATIAQLVDVPSTLPAPALPDLSQIPGLALPALSLAFVCIIQGAGVSRGLPHPEGRTVDASRDVVGQGIGNLIAGLFRGMPVGGSLSASLLVVQAGAKTRLSLFVAGAVMAAVIVVAAPVVAATAMPALAGLLIVVGAASLTPARVRSVVGTGPLQTAVMAVTFVLTLLIPLQYAVITGIGLGFVLFIARQSGRTRLRLLEFSAGRVRESDPPASVPGRHVVVLQPYGSMFFASAPVFERQLPAVDAASAHAVVILRLRGVDDVGIAFSRVLIRYAQRLRAVGGALMIVANEPTLLAELAATGAVEAIGAENVYRGTAWHGEALERAIRDAHRRLATSPGPPEGPA